MGPSGRRFDPCHSDQNFDRKQSLFSTFGHFLCLFRRFAATFEKIAFLRPHHQTWTENSFFFVYSGAIFGGVVSALRLPFSLEALFLSGDFGILFCNHHHKFFFVFFSRVGVDIELFAFAVWQFRRIAAFPFLRADLKQTSRSGAAYFRLFRLKFCSYGRFRRLVGCFPVLAQSALISAETPFDFVGGVVAVGYGLVKVGVVFTNQLINFIVLIGALAVAVANRRNIALRRVAVHKAAV